MQAVDAGQLISNVDLDETSDSVKSSSQSLNSADSPEHVMADLEENLVIPDLPLSVGSVDNKTQSNDPEPSTDQSALADSSTELGELRFAQDGG